MFARLMAPAITVFLAVVAAANGLHPFYHAFEGDSIDAVLDYLSALAGQVAASRPTS